MARTKAQARAQSVPPPWNTQIVARTLDDHGSGHVKIAWSRTNGDTSPLKPYPFHVYLIHGADTLIPDEDLACKLMYCLSTNTLVDPCWHLEVFTTLQDNVFACVNHYEQEQAFRRLGSQAPYMPEKNCFLVIDSDKWKDEGLLYVRYTRETTHIPYRVTAERYKSWDRLSDRLKDEWADQGMTSIEELLDEKNLTRGWPIDLSLYSESGPEQGANGMTLAAEDEAPSTPHQPAQEGLEENISEHIDNIVDEQCQNSEGSSYTALRHNSSQTPLFVFCLFIFGI